MASGRYCKICLSPFRQEIEQNVKRHVPLTKIAEYFIPYMDSPSEVALMSSIKLHRDKKHPPLLKPVPQRSTLEERREEVRKVEIKQEVLAGKVPQSKKTLEEYAQILLDEGFTDEQMKKINPQIILQAQKVLIEKDKAKAQTDYLKLAMSKMMAGLIDPTEAVEGIIMDGEIKRIEG